MTLKQQPHQVTPSLSENDLDASDLDANALFDVLSDPRRRFVVHRLQRATRPMALADLADELARWESESGSDGPSESAVKSSYLSLFHVDVPKLAETGLIEYDAARRTARLA